ncbi:MAG: hypothetical protein KDB61_15385, partial [Planctomycetes bacterium]|nr:hypothetical protein [Planctomycetota bacterium]
WYLAALASVILYPDMVDHESVYPKMIADLLPVGVKGLMVASFISAFVSTITSHYNLTASYAVNDVYRRFMVKGRSAKHYVSASRWATVLIAGLAGVLALLLPSVLDAFRFKMELMAGLGLVYVLRWFWWRVNAWTEIAALGASIVSAVGLKTFMESSPETAANDSALRLLLVVTISAIAAIGTALLTKPEPMERQQEFFVRVRSPGVWGPVAAGTGFESKHIPPKTWAHMGAALVFILAGMTGIGKVCLAEPALGLGLLAVSTVCGVWLLRSVFGGYTAEPVVDSDGV